MPVLDIAAGLRPVRPAEAFINSKALRLSQQMEEQKMAMQLRNEQRQIEQTQYENQRQIEQTQYENQRQKSQDETGRKDREIKLQDAFENEIRGVLYNSKITEDQRMEGIQSIGEKYERTNGQMITPEGIERFKAKIPPPDKKLTNVAKNATLFDEESGTPVYTNTVAGDEKLPAADIQKLELARNILTNPDSPAHDIAWAKKVTNLGQAADDRSTEKERVSADLEKYETEGYETPQDEVRHKLAWLRAEAGGMDPERAGFRNPGVQAKKAKFTALQLKDVKSTIRTLDQSAEWIDSALDNVGPWTIGVPGIAKRAEETIRGFMDPSTQQPAKDFKRMVSKLKAVNWKEMVGSGQISAADYIFLGDIFEGLSVFDDPVATANSLVELRDWLSFKRDGHAASAEFAPPAALRYLKENPEAQAQFDEKYPNG